MYNTYISAYVFSAGATHCERQDLIQEAACMKRLEHPNLLSLVGVCFKHSATSNDSYNVIEPMIVTPFMDNGSLLTYLRTNLKDEVKKKKIHKMNRFSDLFLNIQNPAYTP